MEKPKIISAPSPETKRIAEEWQKKEQKRQNVIKIKQYEKMRAKKAEKMKNRKTNKEIADSTEFQKWCEDHGIKPTKRQARKHRKEFENYLSSKEANLKETAEKIGGKETKEK